MTESQLRNLISNGETREVELKLDTPRPSDLAERMCGLANALGGYIIIGVEDQELKVVGVRSTKLAIDALLRAARQVEPPLTLTPTEPEVYDLDGKKVVVATVPASRGPVYQASGIFFIRRGTHTVPLSYFELLNLGNERGYSSWEEHPARQATLQDLDLDKVRQHLLQRSTRPQHLKRLENMEELLVDLGCAVQAGGELVPTNAGLLFFGRDPQIRIPQSEIVCVLFSDEVGVGHYLDRRIITGTIRELIDQTEKFLEQYTGMGGKVVGWKRVDLPEYPRESLREAVVNAVIHRDYSKAGEIIRVFKYTDRIEIRSPGALMPGVSVDLLRQGKAPSKLRNTVLGNLLRDVPGYFERIGSGVRFMLEEANRLEAPAPDFQEAGEFVVTFRQNPALAEKAASPEEPVKTPAELLESEPDMSSPRQRYIMALKHVQQHGSITTGEYVSLTGISERTALRDLEELVNRGSLRRLGKRRASRYELPQ